MPWYAEDQYVRAEIFQPGTSSGGEVSLTTVDLTHRSTGRYSEFYTPPEGYDFLDIVFTTYSDSGYTTKNLDYNAYHDQIVLHGFSAGGFPIGDVNKTIGKDETDKIIKAVIDNLKPSFKKLEGLFSKDTNSFKEIQIVLKEYLKQTPELFKKINNFPLKHQKMNEETIGKIVDIVRRSKTDISSLSRELKVINNKLDKLDKPNNNEAIVNQQLNNINNKLDKIIKINEEMENLIGFEEDEDIDKLFD